jgi:UDP-glucose 4-epimerase
VVRLGESHSKRVLLTGLGTYWGGKLAQALEQDEEIEAIIGVDNRDPTLELERTEFVRVGTQHALLRRIVEAAEIDTVIDTRLVVDSVTTSARLAHENNVIGTMNILAACSGPDSSVRRFVFKSSAHYYGAEQDDPAFFTESMRRPHPPRTPIERDIVEAEAAVEDFAEKNPDVSVTLFRFANVLGGGVITSHTQLFALPAVPMIFGFDPRYQFVHEDDVVAALAHAVVHDLPGTYNVAADGVLALTEVIDLLGKPFLPILPPWGTGAALAPLRRLGLRIPTEMLSQMRYGRGLDNRKLKATGFTYRYTTRETVMALAEAQRLQPILRGAREPFRYEREVEEFLRWSPYVRNPNYRRDSGVISATDIAELQRLMAGYAAKAGGSAGRVAQRLADQELSEAQPEEPGGDDAGGRNGSESERAAAIPFEHYDDLDPGEIIGLLDSLEPDDLAAIRDYERAHRGRTGVLSAVERRLARGPAEPRP